MPLHFQCHANRRCCNQADENKKIVVCGFYLCLCSYRCRGVGFSLGTLQCVRGCSRVGYGTIPGRGGVGLCFELNVAAIEYCGEEDECVFTGLRYESIEIVRWSVHM